MSPVTNETKIALLEQRMDLVETRVETVAAERPTTQEVEMMIAKSTPSMEEFKTGMTEVLVAQGGQEKKDTRNWVVELIRAILPAGIATIVVALIDLAKG